MKDKVHTYCCASNLCNLPLKITALSDHFCLFWYWCYYLHRLRDSVSPVCRIVQGVLQKEETKGYLNMK